MERKLYRNIENKKIFGVCSGFSDYLGVDVTIVRLVVALLSLVGGIGVLPYLICAFVIPVKPDNLCEFSEDASYSESVKWRCASCGVVNSDDGDFCSICGAARVKPEN